VRAVVQRCSAASVRVGDELVAAIGRGAVAFVGVAADDGPADVRYLCDKIAGLRILPGPDGRLQVGLAAGGAALLLVPQFTLYGDVRRGLRPDFTAAAPPEVGRARLAELASALRQAGLEVAEGRFGAHMRVDVAGDGPVTILLDSRRTF
jgi:D-tyrosyl-tRNA(Tyr) deacylase